MRVSISIPVGLFEEVEEFVRRTGKTRSAVYRMALEYFVAQHDIDRARNDFVNAWASRVLEKSEW